MPQDPAQIQRQIEDARAELASTVEQIADRVSPKKVAARGVVVVRTKVDDAFTKPVEQPSADGGKTIGKSVRWDRVGIAGGGAAALLLLLLRRRKRKAAVLPRAAQKAATIAQRKARTGNAKPLDGRKGKKADRKRADLLAALTELQRAWASLPTSVPPAEPASSS